MVVLVAALVMPLVAALAQEKKVPVEESKILLLLPHLEDLVPVYQYFGWNAQASMETAYGGLARDVSTPSRGQVYLHQLAPITYWRSGTDLDATWIRDSFPFFKDKTVRITAAAPKPGPLARVARFEADGAACTAFELRAIINNPAGASSLEERQSVSGIYCPPANVALDDALIQRVFEGIFVRRDGRIERALRGVDKPLPQKLVRGEQQKG
jgi:hypothetical protein